MNARRYDFNGPAGVPANVAYAGELALPYMSAALKSGATLANNWIRTLDDVPYKAALDVVTGAGLIKDASCDFTDAGSVTITERVLSVEEFQVNIDLCKKTMRQGWQAKETGNSLNSQMPSSFTDHVIGHISGLVAEQVENNIWNGNTATSGSFTGFATATVGLLNLDADVNDVTLSATFTKANIVAELEKVLDVVDSQVLGHPDFALYVSPKTLYLYQQALGASGYQLDYQANAKPSNIYGYPILACPGMLNDTIIATYKDNLAFGSNILTNMTEVRVMDMSALDGSDNVRFVMRYAAGVQHAIGGDIWFGQ
jgi:hypothetical protein